MSRSTILFVAALALVFSVERNALAQRLSMVCWLTHQGETRLREDGAKADGLADGDREWIWGHSERLVELGVLSEGAQSEVDRRLGRGVRVGFLYDRVHLFGLDFWTWSGRFVLVRDADVWELSDQAWGELLGEGVELEFVSPVSYRWPLGLGVMAVLVGVLALGLGRRLHRRRASSQ